MRLLVSDRRLKKIRVMVIDGNFTRYSELELNVLYVHFLTKLLFFNQTSRKMNHSQVVGIASALGLWWWDQLRCPWAVCSFFEEVKDASKRGSCITKEHWGLEVMKLRVSKNWCNLRLMHLKGSRSWFLQDKTTKTAPTLFGIHGTGNFCLQIYYHK